MTRATEKAKSVGLVPSRYLSLLLLVVATGCGPPQDDSGRRPEAIVKAFTESVQSQDFEKAKTFWKPASIVKLETDYKQSFQEFCQEKVACKQPEIEKAIKQKAQFYSVEFRCEEGGQRRIFIFYLEMVNGEWVLSHDVWRSDLRN